MEATRRTRTDRSRPVAKAAAPPRAESLGRFVSEHPAATSVLTRHGIDFHDRTRPTLELACAAAGVPVDTIRGAVAAEECTIGDQRMRWAERPLGELIDHIVERYHAPLLRELARMVELAHRLSRAHPGEQPLQELAQLLVLFSEEVSRHLTKEEMAVFPWIARHAGARSAGPIQALENDHAVYGFHLGRMRGLTDGYAPPPGASVSWYALYSSIAELDRELKEHLHLEDDILFPRALAVAS